MYHGKAEEILRLKRLNKYAGRTRLIFTSPPFPLAKGKKYGNEIGEDYIDGLSEWKARQKASRIDPDTIRILKDGFLRLPMKMEEHQSDDADASQAAAQ
jgi:hypothetical protein